MIAGGCPAWHRFPRSDSLPGRGLLFPYFSISVFPYFRMFLLCCMWRGSCFPSSMCSAVFHEEGIATHVCHNVEGIATHVCHNVEGIAPQGDGVQLPHKSSRSVYVMRRCTLQTRRPLRRTRSRADVLTHTHVTQERLGARGPRERSTPRVAGAAARWPRGRTLLC